MELILNNIFKSSAEIIVCGDLINYFNDNSKKHVLDYILASFSLFSTANFPTRISNASCTLIDNIYINTYRLDFSLHPLSNGLSDYDMQIITFPKILISFRSHLLSFTWEINNNSLSRVILLLNNENLEDVFIKKNFNIIFNNFLNTFLRIFYSSFPNKKFQYS